MCRESRLVYKVQDGIPVMLIEGRPKPLDEGGVSAASVIHVDWRRAR
ncbi:hypothetical protein [Gemmatimonas sp.]